MLTVGTGVTGPRLTLKISAIFIQTSTETPMPTEKGKACGEVQDM